MYGELFNAQLLCLHKHQFHIIMRNENFSPQVHSQLK